jgi:large subunit ribosomal protein L22
MKYASAYDSEKMARAQAVALPVSFKQSAEICRHIRNKPYRTAIRILEQAISLEVAIPFTRFNRGGTGHRKGIGGPGRYPVKASTQLLKLLKSAYANASQKGLNTNELIVKSAVAKQGPKTPKYGRIRGRKAKRTHVEIVLLQAKPAEKESRKPAKKQAQAAKTEMKTEAK